MIVRSVLLAGATVLAACPTLVAAQAPERGTPPSWNDARVLNLVERARERRSSNSVDESFRTYQADARGYVYFYIDRPDEVDHVLVKADQVALDLYWRAPNDAKQRIVGLRGEEVLPTSVRYHLDHLTVVQDDYGDRIRLGDGDEVEEVLHPVGPASEEVYDFQLVDSLRLSYAADSEEVRVYEVRVRPKDLGRPGFVGTIFLDRASGAIVRMNFSFTPSSYVDPYLDYIRISLDNSLWMGRFWLPYRQEVELRRETPILDFSAGSVIRSRFEIGDYDFNVELDNSLFVLRGVGAVSVRERQAFPFERGLFDEVDEEGLTISTKMEEVRTQVREVVEDQVLSGLSPVRFHLDGLSDFARYNRAEGVFLGAGLTLRPRGDMQVRPRAGYAFGRGEASGAVTASLGGRLTPTLHLLWNEVGDVGGNPGATPLVNTISAASGDEDFLDPYFRRGGALSLGSTLGSGLAVQARVERHESATDVVSDGPDTEFRPVRSVDEGTLTEVGAAVRFNVPGEGRARLSAALGRLAEDEFTRGQAEVEWPIQSSRDPWHARVRGQAGVTSTGAPVQEMFLIGGRHTLPGHDYRAFLGNAFWLLRAEVTVPVRRPYLGLRAIGVAGATRLGDVILPSDWSTPDSGGVRGSIGAGLSIAWDTAFLDVAHGVRGGGWEGIFSVAQRFQGWM